MGRYGDINYPRVTKYGFLLGVALFAVGGVGELLGTALYGSLPSWEITLFTGMEAVGILAGLLFPMFFGVVLPLTE